MPPRKQEGREGAVLPRFHWIEGTLDMDLGPDEDTEEEAGNPGSVFQCSSHRFNMCLTHEIDRQMPPGFRAAQMCLPGLAGLCSEQCARPSGVWHAQDCWHFSATHLAP